MDVVGNLPPEVNERIFKQLDGKDLWSCLAVNKTWRTHSNTDRLWIPLCKYYGVIPCEVAERDDLDEFSLCTFASEWRRCWCKVYNWTNRKFQIFDLPHMECPKFFSSNNHLAITDGLSNGITILPLRDDPPNWLNISLPAGVEYLDDNVVMNDNYVIMTYNNIVIVYKRDVSYTLHSIFAIKDVQSQFTTTNFVQFLKNNEDMTVTCDFSYVSHNKFWAGFVDRYNSCQKYQVLIDIKTNEVTYIKHPFNDVVIEIIGMCHRIVFQYMYEIIIYETDGNMLFKVHVGEFCSASANDNIIAIFKSKTIDIYDILNGVKLNSFSNECYQPQIFVMSCRNIVFVTRRDVKHDVIFALNAASGKKLWSFKIPIPFYNYSEKSLTETFGSLLVINVDGNVIGDGDASTVYLLNIENGDFLHEDCDSDLHFLNQNCFVKYFTPMKLFLV